MIALLVGLGSSAWIYGKMMKNNGLTQNALIVAGVGGIFVFVIVLIVANMFL